MGDERDRLMKTESDLQDADLDILKASQRDETIQRRKRFGISGIVVGIVIVFFGTIFIGSSFHTNIYSYYLVDDGLLVFGLFSTILGAILINVSANLLMTLLRNK